MTYISFFALEKATSVLFRSRPKFEGRGMTSERMITLFSSPWYSSTVQLWT